MIIETMPRVIYNRVAKAGSTAMSVLIVALSRINHFHFVNFNVF
jgi:hypothetical protein